MSKKPLESNDEEMREEYDFSQGVRGKYTGRIRGGCNVVLLEQDVARAFPDSKAVNRILRVLIRIASQGSVVEKKRPRRRS